MKNEIILLSVIVWVFLGGCGSKEPSEKKAAAVVNDRVLIFNEAGFQVTVPASWKKEMYRVNQLSESDREKVLPEAAEIINIEYLPVGYAGVQPNLVSIIVVADEYREEILNDENQSSVAVMGRNSDFIYLLTLPQTNPFPDTGEDFVRYNQLARGLGTIISSFEILYGAVPPTVEEIVGRAFAAQLPAADGPGRIITLRCSDSENASLTTEFIGKGEPFKEAGSWNLEAHILSYQPLNRDSVPMGARMKWTVKGEFLIPLEWDKTLYGSTGLPLRRLKS